MANNNHILDRHIQSQIDRNLVEYYNDHNLEEDTKHEHELIVQQLTEKITVGSDHRPTITLFGSAVNGFGTDECDLDMLFLFTSPWKKKFRKVFRILKKDPMIEEINFINANVPILRFKYRLNDRIFDCDMSHKASLNSHMAVYRSELLLRYSQINPVVPILGLFVKNWAKERGVCGHGHPTSYAWTVMVIHYLQRVGILPYLEDIKEVKVPMEIKTSSPIPAKVSIVGDIPNLNDYFSQTNSDSLTALLIGFFQYFGHQYDLNRVITTRRIKPLAHPSEDGAAILRHPLVRGRWKGKYQEFGYIEARNALREAYTILTGTNQWKSMKGDDIIDHLVNN